MFQVCAHKRTSSRGQSHHQHGDGLVVDTWVPRFALHSCRYCSVWFQNIYGTCFGSLPPRISGTLSIIIFRVLSGALSLAHSGAHSRAYSRAHSRGHPRIYIYIKHIKLSNTTIYKISYFCMYYCIVYG